MDERKTRAERIAQKVRKKQHMVLREEAIITCSGLSKV